MKCAKIILTNSFHFVQFILNSVEGNESVISRSHHETHCSYELHQLSLVTHSLHAKNLHPLSFHWSIWSACTQYYALNVRWALLCNALRPISHCSYCTLNSSIKLSLFVMKGSRFNFTMLFISEVNNGIIVKSLFFFRCPMSIKMILFDIDMIPERC